MYYQNICRIPYVRKNFPLHYIFEMLLIIGGKGWKEKAWLSLHDWQLEKSLLVSWANTIWSHWHINVKSPREKRHVSK